MNSFCMACPCVSAPGHEKSATIPGQARGGRCLHQPHSHPGCATQFARPRGLSWQGSTGCRQSSRRGMPADRQSLSLSITEDMLDEYCRLLNNYTTPPGRLAAACEAIRKQSSTCHVHSYNIGGDERIKMMSLVLSLVYLQIGRINKRPGSNAPCCSK